MDYANCDEEDEEFVPEMIIRMSMQLLKAIRFIHSAGMCHGGERFLNRMRRLLYLHNIDISGMNLAFTCSSLLGTTKEEIFEAIGSPKVEPVAHEDGGPLPKGLPTELVEAAEWEDWIDEDEEDIRILDLGQSFLQAEEPEKLAQPGILRAPETIFTGNFDYRVDLWSAGDTVSETI